MNTAVTTGKDERKQRKFKNYFVFWWGWERRVMVVSVCLRFCWCGWWEDIWDRLCGVFVWLKQGFTLFSVEWNESGEESTCPCNPPPDCPWYLHSEKCTGPPTPCGEERCSCPHPSSRHCKDWEQFPTIKGMKKHYSKNVLSKNSAVMRIQENHPHHRDGIHLSVGLKPTAHSALPFDTPAGTSRSFPTPPQPMSEGRTSGTVSSIEYTECPQFPRRNTHCEALWYRKDE